MPRLAGPLRSSAYRCGHGPRGCPSSARGEAEVWNRETARFAAAGVTTFVLSMGRFGGDPFEALRALAPA